MKCANCNTENRDGARVCRQCGRPLVPSEMSTGPMAPESSQPPAGGGGNVTCPACGAQVKAGAHFCARCGSPMGAAAGQGATGAGQPPQGPFPSSEPQSYSRSIPQGVPSPSSPSVESTPYAKPPVDIASSSGASPQQPVVRTAVPVGKPAGTRKRKFPIWAIILIIVVFLLCAAGTVYAGMLLADRFFPSDAPEATAVVGEDGEEEKAEQVVPGATETPAPTTTPTPEPAGETPAALATESPAAESESLEFRVQPGFPSSFGDLTSFPFEVFVKSAVPDQTLEDVRCQLEGRWIPYFTVDGGADFRIEESIPPGEDRACRFTLTPNLQAITAGAPLPELSVYVTARVTTPSEQRVEDFVSLLRGGE